MKTVAETLREAGWEEVNAYDAGVGPDEMYVLGGGPMVLRAPRPEPEYESGTVALVQPVGRRGPEVVMRTDNGCWWAIRDVYAPEEVEVLRVIAYPDGSIPAEGFEADGVNRVEVVDNTGRAYVNTSAEDVDLSFQDDGRTLKVFTGGTGSTPRRVRSRPGDSFGQCTTDIDALNERITAGLQWTLDRLYEGIDRKDDTK